MNKKILLLACLIFSFGTLYSQECSLTGTIIDQRTKSPIPYANVVITSPTDSTVLLGAITNDNGNYIVEKVPQGAYTISFSFIGYKTIKNQRVEIKSGKNEMGTHELEPISENLDEITVKANKQAVSYRVDKKVIDAESFPSANVAMDLLENIPSVQVDYDGKLTYRGDGTFRVFVNGKPVANGEEKLRQLSTSKIERIEIITNPSAKYDAEGTAGIIQVILKQNRLEGYAISSSAQATTQGAYDWTTSIEKQDKKGGWYFNTQFGDRISHILDIEEVQNIQQGNDHYYIVTDQKEKFSAFNNWIEFGLNYDITDKHYIDFSTYVNVLKNTNVKTITGNVSEQLNELATAEYDLESDWDLYYRYLGATLTYEYAFNKDRSHLLSAYFDLTTYLHPLDEEQIDDKIYPTYNEKVGYKSKEHNELIFEAKVTYSNEISDKSSFETGTSVYLDHIPKVTSISGTYSENNELIPFPDEPTDQEIDFIQDVYSAFAVFKSSFNKFEYQIGIRSEYTFRKSDYRYKSSEGNEILVPADKEFIDFFPSLHTLYNFSETHQLGFSYSKRIERPSYWKLIPLKQYSTPYLYYTGNGNLSPSYANAFELVYKKSWDDNYFGAEIFARNIENVIQNYTRTDAKNMLLMTPENVGDSWSTGTEVMFGMDVTKWWNINLSSSLFMYQLNINIDDVDETENQLRSDHRINNTFNLPKNFTFKFDLNYKSPEVKAQSKRKGYFFSNLALRKGFLDNKWQIQLAATNIANSIRYELDEKGTDFDILTDYTRRPYFSFKLTYSFNNQK